MFSPHPFHIPSHPGFHFYSEMDSEPKAQIQLHLHHSLLDILL